MAKNVVVILLLLLAQVFVSCGFKEPVKEVVSGNFNVTAGNYEIATLEYFRAMSTGLCEEWIRYNLGNVYGALGEPEYAAIELRKALAGKDPELLFRARFNLGNIFFEQGEYMRAFEEYKAALRIKPASPDAKKNLEMTTKRMENEEKRRASSQSGETRMTSEVIQTLKNAKESEVYVMKYAEPGGSAVQKKDW
jgi:tetratricopeptide (TPR) repeat protein